MIGHLTQVTAEIGHEVFDRHPTEWLGQEADCFAGRPIPFAEGQSKSGSRQRGLSRLQAGDSEAILRIEMKGVAAHPLRQRVAHFEN